MKHMLAAAAVAILVAAAPASAQVAEGFTTAPNDFGPNFEPSGDGNFRGPLVLYSTLGPVAAPPAANTASALATGNVAVGAWLANPAPIVPENAAAFVMPTNAVDPVPEPATWAMMLVGFAAVGATLRSRKTTLRYA